LSLTVLLAACAGGTVGKDTAFTRAVESVQDEAYRDGAREAYAFIEAADPDDPRYDRGLRLLARAADGLELSWSAGMIYRQIAKVRRNMEIVPDALIGLERIVDSGVYDEDILVTSFIAAEQFGDLPAAVQAFVDFYQGLDLARRGDEMWSEKRFAKLPPSSRYAARAEYVRIVRLIADGALGEAIERLNALGEHPALTAQLRLDVERSLARLAFEEQRYEDALVHFEKLRGLAPDDPEILLEMAWTHYYMGNSRKTLGLLVALDAPVHQTFISPERYLLEALALRRLCQFGAAREAAVRLERRYARSLTALARGKPLEDIEEMRVAARRRGQSRENARLARRLVREREMVQALADELGAHLTTYLTDMYDRGLAESRRREAELIPRDITELAEELLGAREGVRLIVHELGVALLRGRRRPGGAEEKPAVEIPVSGDRVFYGFTGEYWTDELDDLVVIAEDRCID